jgi:(p)ppGpp synthase/HD superfamily hydrolase
MTKIDQAKQFAHEAHDSINQRRKYTHEPYWIHTDEVAQIVADVGGTQDMICAAHLHDVVEDVTLLNPIYDLFAIGNLFGANVAKLVTELTDVYTKEAWPNLNRVKRKKLECERVSKISLAAKTIKLADFLSNTKSIVQYDPDFAVTYLKEKIAMLPYLKEGHADLWNRCNNQVTEACQTLKLNLY